jgi:hypothetical protein
MRIAAGNEDLADREPGVDVIADVAPLGALVAAGEVLLLTVHHSDARTIAFLALLLLGLLVRNLAILIHQRLAPRDSCWLRLGVGPPLLLLRFAPGCGVGGGFVMGWLRGRGFVLRVRFSTSEHLMNTTFGE